MDDINDPVELYKVSLKDDFAQKASEFFESLVKTSNVNEEENKRLVAEIRELETCIQESGNSSRLWRILRGGLIFSSLVMLFFAYNTYTDVGFGGGMLSIMAFLASGVGLILLTIYRLNPKISAINEELDRLKAVCAEKTEMAWTQMQPLNSLFQWSGFATLVQNVLPQMSFDPYFSNQRLRNLRTSYGFDDVFNQSRSVLFAHSGALFGHPFVFSKSIDHWMGTKTYYGTRQIQWTTVERDSQGNSRTVRHTETLRASIEKSYPEYAEEANIIYGNPAAPDLSFTRVPSSLSSAGDGVIDRWRKARATKKLEAKARKIDDGVGFTMMSNREFDTLFSATDRDHEIQFRLLFTPLAQQCMVKLLKDNEVGFGDSFGFQKSKMINIISANHLSEDDISASPGVFRGFDLHAVREGFNAYYNKLFKGLFFSLAPLFIISIYQQTPVKAADVEEDDRQSCFWEHEAIANYFGEDEFKHPDSVTRNILGTSVTEVDTGAQIVEVTAYGYYGEDRMSYVTVRGSDGNDHSVAVSWIEYLPISNSSQLLICDPASGRSDRDDDWKAQFSSRGIDSENIVIWRGIRVAKL